MTTGQRVEPVKKNCNRCGADIVWAITDRGKTIPVDWQWSRNGRYRLDTSGPRVRAQFLTATAAKHEVQRGGAVHNNHLTTCIKRGFRR